MKNKIIIACLFFLTGTISCKKNETSSKAKSTSINISKVVEQFLYKADSDKKTGDIYFTRNDAAWVKNESPDINISASFWDKPNGHLIGDKQVYINNFELPFFNNSTPGFFIQSIGKESDIINRLNSLWGNNVKLSISSSNVSSRLNNISGDFYVPQTIEMESSFCDSYIIDPSKNTTITWNTDPVNPIQSVFVGISIDSYYDQTYLPTESEVIYFSELPDSGTTDLLASDLQGLLPVGSRVTIFLIRANYTTIVDPDTGYETLVTALTYSSSGSIAVQEDQIQ